MKTATGTGGAWGRSVAIGLVLVAGLVIPLTTLQSQQPTLGYIQGTVRSTAGPEAGVNEEMVGIWAMPRPGKKAHNV